MESKDVKKANKKQAKPDRAIAKSSKTEHSLNGLATETSVPETDPADIQPASDDQTKEAGRTMVAQPEPTSNVVEASISQAEPTVTTEIEDTPTRSLVQETTPDIKEETVTQEPPGDAPQKPVREAGSNGSFSYVPSKVPEKSDPAPQKRQSSTQVVTADAVLAEDVPTIPLGPLQTISDLQPEVSIHPVAATRTVQTPSPLVVQPAEYRRSLGEWMQVWWEGIRPSYLALPIMPLVIGSVLAWTHTISARSIFGHFNLIYFLGALITLVLLQTGANLVNDYYDYIRGIDTSNTFGPGGLIQQGLVRPTRVLIMGLSFLGIGTLLGLFVALPGWPLVYLFGLFGILCAYFYSASQRSLSSLALGEVVGFCVFGPLITLGAYILQQGQATPAIFIYSISIGLFAAAVIHINNMRDAEGDSQAGKHTLASILGLGWSRVWYLLLLLGGYAIIAALAIPSGTPHLLLIVFWTLPLLAVIITGVLRTDTPAGQHLILEQTIRLEIYFSILLAIALLVSALFPLLPRLPASLLPF